MGDRPSRGARDRVADEHGQSGRDADRVRDRQPQLYDQIEEELLSSGIRFVPPDVEQARIVAEARFRYPLNLGDCFAYALAIIENVRSSPRIRISGK